MLPPPSEFSVADLPPWSIVTTSMIVTALEIDRGAWAVWRLRGIGPAELPSVWFRHGNGRPLHYRIDAIQSWLASRRGETFDTLTAWRSWLSNHAGVDLPADDPNEIREWALRWARGQGAGAYVEDGIRFTHEGYESYLTNLLL